MKTNQTSGWLFGIGAFLLWGLFPIYFKALGEVPALEILAHRITWSAPVVFLLMLLLKTPVLMRTLLGNKRILLGLTASTLLVATNWFIFTWAVTQDRILETSLGYFINPILSILLGVLFLKERLTLLQKLAVFAVALGVVNQIVVFGSFPWLALSVAVSFAAYGFIRKLIKVDSLNGLLIETSIALPFALVYILYLLYMDKSYFLKGPLAIDVLLLSGGIVTVIPLLMFGAAATKIPLNAVGFLQFITPTMSFVLAVWVYYEPLGYEQLLSFMFIWLGIILYLIQPIKKLFKVHHG